MPPRGPMLNNMLLTGPGIISPTLAQGAAAVAAVRQRMAGSEFQSRSI